MKLTPILSLNAIIWIAIGIAYALFGYLMLNLFGIPDIPENSQAGLLLYNNILAFARMYGATLITLGFLLYSIRSLPASTQIAPETRRGIVFSLALGNAIAAFIAVIEQFRTWQSLGGWVMVLVPAVFFAIYVYFLATGFKVDND